MKIKNIIQTIVVLLTVLFPVYAAQAQVMLNRGEAVDQIVKYFELETRRGDYLQSCDIELEFCLFDFLARTDFVEYRMEPLILFPDVYPAHPAYQSINLATKLGLISGYYAETNSPFKPQNGITKVEALKIVMGAADLISWREKFEMSQEWLGLENSYNQLAASSESMQLVANLATSLDEWWKARYIVAGAEKQIISTSGSFNPDQGITAQELQIMLENTNVYLANNGETDSAQVNLSGDSKLQAKH